MHHVEVCHYFCPVPHALVHEQVDVRFGAATAELFQKGQRVGSHARSQVRRRPTTTDLFESAGKIRKTPLSTLWRKGFSASRKGGAATLGSTIFKIFIAAPGKKKVLVV